MKFIKILLVQAIILTSFYLPASAQSDTAVLNHIIAKTAKIYNSFPAEKVYLHFDKPYYALGDTIWFKAYVTIDYHLPSSLSRIVYADILGPRDSLIQAVKLQVKNGVAWGHFALSQYTYKKGNYRVVAFTNWMQNNDAGYFFNKAITIGDAINNNISTQISLRTITAGKAPKISARVFFKDADGNPYAIKKVNWTVEKDYETLIKGKGETDKNGFIDISFVNTKNVALDSATMITILDAGRKQYGSTFPLRSVAEPDDIQFFAEGGQLINGLTSKVAFKATAPSGLGIEVKGTITDNTNKVVAEFASSHLGMGAFAFTPEHGKTYVAKVTFADGTTAVPDLPKMQTGGIAISLENSNPDYLRLRLQADTTFVSAYKGKTFFILAKCSGVICFAAKTPLQSQVYNAAIPKTKFPTGIVQVTLLTDEGEPVSERIAFIQHNDGLNLALKTDKPAYAARQKVNLNISAKNSDQPAEGTFSVAVVDDSKVPFDENAETTILTNLLLTSDIKGYIEKPNYYFNHPGEKTAADLDILMQTQGYRRYSYEGIMSNKYPQIRYLPETSLAVTGTLRASNGIPVKNGNIHLYIADKNFSTNTVTDADGKFAFTNLTFTDSSKLTVSAKNNLHSSDLVLTIDGEPGQRVPKNINSPDEVLNIDSTLSAYLKNSKAQFNNSNTLKEVVIRSTKIEKTVSHKDFSSLSSLSSEADHTVPGKLFQGCTMLLECLQGLATGMQYQDNNFYVMRDYSQGNRTPAAIFFRGQPIDVNALSSVNPAEIESVEIFYKDELGLINSAYGTNGAIVINMKKPAETTKITLQQLKDMVPQPNEVTFSPKGYEPALAFYMPKYAGPRETQTSRLDTRSTIYWNPNVMTDKAGNASIEFYNADGTGTYRVIIEGIDREGNIGRQVIHYPVNNR